VSTATEYTLSEMILLAAHKLEEQGQSPFSAEDLIVAAWKEYPRAFGLKGYTDQFPDSNRVLSSIMGERGLTRKGWLAKMGQKLYALSPDGRRVVKRILEGAEPEPDDVPAAARPPRELERLLGQLLDSAAWEKYVERKTAEVSFADACRFWGLADGLTGDAIDDQLAAVDRGLRQAERLTARGAVVIGERELTAADVGRLKDVHEHLQERFQRHLTLLRNRPRRP
jgi:hypothetical protein